MSVIETGGVVLSLHRSRSSLAGWDYFIAPDSGRSSFRGLIRRRAVSEAGRPDGRAIIASASRRVAISHSTQNDKRDDGQGVVACGNHGREADFSTTRPTIRLWTASVEMTVVGWADRKRRQLQKQEQRQLQNAGVSPLRRQGAPPPVEMTIPGGSG